MRDDGESEAQKNERLSKTILFSSSWFREAYSNDETITVRVFLV